MTDDQGNITEISSDNLRRTVIDNPDTGRVESVYDLAGNVVQKITANLEAEGKAILYGYRFNRLERITYAFFHDNDVVYTYGGADLLGQPGNPVGRTTKMTDQSGTEERW